MVYIFDMTPKCTGSLQVFTIFFVGSFDPTLTSSSVCLGKDCFPFFGCWGSEKLPFMLTVGEAKNIPTLLYPYRESNGGAEAASPDGTGVNRFM